MSTPPIQLGGLVSGMDVDSVISQLMAIEQQPRQQMIFKQAAANARKSGLASIEDKLKTLALANDDLRSVATWAPTQTVESSDTTRLTATLHGGAAPGGYAISVTQLATSSQQTFTFTPQAAASTITVGSTTIALDANASIDDAAAAINADPDAGVYAVNIGGDRLVLSSRTTGAGSGFTAAGAALAADPSTPARAGQDAVMTINGATVTSSSNTVTAQTVTSGVPIPGVDFTIKALTDSTTLSVSPPGTDRAALTDKLKAFVTAYNDVLSSISALTSQKAVATPAGTTDAAQGALFGDSGLNSIVSTLRLLTGSPVPNAPSTLSTLAQIGISTGATTGDATISDDAVSGKLTFDEDALNAALDSDPLAVQRLLGGQLGTAGFSQALDAAITPLSQVGGVLDQRISSVDDDISAITDSISRLDDRLSAEEDRLRAQFTAMEAAMQQSQSLTQQLLAQLGEPVS